MALRTTNAAVVALLAGDYDASAATDLTRFVLMANKLTDRAYTCALNKGITLDTDELETIECLLAAHFYQGSDQGYTSRSTKSASGSFKGAFTRKLDGTTYGQNAMLMDYSGCLENIDKRNIASVGWGGKPLSDQLTYDQRN